jgi:hypothetical protein
MAFAMGSKKRLPQQPRETSSNDVLFLGFYIKLILFVGETKGSLYHRNFKRFNKNLHTRLQDVTIYKAKLKMEVTNHSEVM